VYIWDPATGNELRRWLACSGSVYNVAFSPDGNTLASGGETTTRNADAKSTEECTVAVWDPKTGRKLRECFIGRACHGVAFSPDGKLLAAAFDDRHDKSWIGLYDPAAGKELARIRAYAAFIAFAPDGKTLAVRKGDMVQFRSVPDLKPTGSVPTAYDSGADALAFSPDGKSLAVCDSSRIRLWDLTTKKEKSDLPGHQREIVSLTIPHDGKTVITAGSWDGTARRWDIATGKQLQVFQGKHDDLHGTLVWSASLSPDGKKLALAHAGAAGVTLL
jgi:WD40 repeat protein